MGKFLFECDWNPHLQKQWRQRCSSCSYNCSFGNIKLSCFGIININLTSSQKFSAKAYFHLSRSCRHFNYNHFMKKQLLFNRHFRNSVAGIRSFKPITWQAPPQSFTISWPEVRAFRPFQTFSTAAQQRQVMAALYYF